MYDFVFLNTIIVFDIHFYYFVSTIIYKKVREKENKYESRKLLKTQMQSSSINRTWSKCTWSRVHALASSASHIISEFDFVLNFTHFHAIIAHIFSINYEFELTSTLVAMILQLLDKQFDLTSREMFERVQSRRRLHDSSTTRSSTLEWTNDNEKKWLTRDSTSHSWESKRRQKKFANSIINFEKSKRQ